METRGRKPKEIYLEFASQIAGAYDTRSLPYYFHIPGKTAKQRAKNVKGFRDSKALKLLREAYGHIFIIRDMGQTMLVEVKDND